MLSISSDKISSSEIENNGITNKSMIEVICTALYIFILLEDPIERIIPNIRLFDELLFIASSFFASLVIFKKKYILDKKVILIIFFSIFIVLIGLMGNCITGYQDSYLAIFKDIIAVIKFPLGFLAFMYLLNDIERGKIFNIYSSISKVFIAICFIFGVFNILFPTESLSHDFRHGIWSYKFTFSHPTFLVFCLVLCFVSLVAVNKKFDIYKLLCLFTLALTMRDKAFAFIVLVLLIYIFRMENKRKLIPYIILSLIVIGLVVFPKLSEYIASYNSPRQALYINGINIANLYFPLGGGLGSWGSSLSGEYYSAAYALFDVNNMDGLRSDAYYDTGDAGFAYYIGEYGWLGFAVVLIILYFIFIIVYRTSDINSGVRVGVISVFGYLILALTVETVLTNASGIELAFMLALLIGKKKSFHHV